MDQNYNQGNASTLRFQDMLLILWRRSWVIALVLGTALGISYYVSKHMPPVWKADADLLVLQRAPSFSMSPQAAYNAPILETPDTQVGLLQSFGMATRAINWRKNELMDRGQSSATIQMTPQQLQKILTITQFKDTNLIDVAVESGDKEEAVRWADAVCKAFVQWKKDVSQQNSQDALTNLESRAKRARIQTLEAERQEVEFKQNRHIVDATAEQSASLQRSTALDTEIATTQQDLSSQEARLHALGQRLQNVDEAIRDGSGVRDDSLVLSLQTQLSNLEVERVDAAQKVTPEFPGILPDLDSKISDIRTRLAQAVKSTLDNKKPSLQSQGTLFEDYEQAQVNLLFTRSKLNALTSQHNQIQKELASLPQTGLHYARLAQNVELARSLSLSLQAALNAARLNKDMTSGNVEISQYAVAADDPVRPNRLRDMAIGGTIGLILSIASVLLMEQSDRRLRNLGDVRRLTSGTVIGAIPQLSRSERQQMLRGNTPTHMVESYSLLRANLALALRSAGENCQSIMVTSAIPGEGKSVTAVQLARTLARAGNRVILVDADMRRSSLRALLPANTRPGLAEVLTGATPLEEALADSGTDNLLLLNAGRASSNPTDLISLPSMAETLEALRRLADMVILDTPAASVVADALLLAPHVDCIVHVIGAGKAEESIVADTATALSASGPKSMFFVMNGGSRGRSYRGYDNFQSYDSSPIAGSASGGENLSLPRIEPIHSDAPNDATQEDEAE